jgi:hypothetical protein
MINTPGASKKFIFLLGFMLLISSLLSAGCGKEMNEVEQSEVKVQMEQYLQEKYGKEFTMKKPYFYTAQLGSQRETISNGHPKDNPQIKVKVTTGPEGTHDNYLLEYEINEANIRMKKTLDDVYGKDNAFPDSSFGLDDHTVYDQKWGRTPSLDELIGKYSNQMDYKLCMVVFKDLNPEQFTEECKNVYKIVNYMKSLKLKETSITVYYLPASYKKKFVSMISDKGIRELDSSKKTYTFGIYIDGKNLNQIKSPEDIKKYIKIKE